MDDLETPIWFTALSYTWGPPVFEAAFTCNGHPKPITRSLEAALRRFRDTKKSIVLWVDQICINQDDNDEKVGQIKLMAHIYTRALNTVIWVGESSDTTPKGMSLITEIRNFQDLPEPGLL